MGSELKSVSRRERFQHWFRMFDINRDGHIDRSDYVLMAERIANAARADGSTRATASSRRRMHASSKSRRLTSTVTAA